MCEIPALTILEEYLRDGHTIFFKEGRCLLLNELDEAVAWGNSLEEMLVMLVLADV